ncbi:MAG: isoprenylcysteine carboxylmethyltransferase family protein [Gammaproteobacteria bacterium]|nr:isoprenylcysteine carboxylmethyltransferase family protein [Gammaproteobacteria bacterium]
MSSVNQSRKILPPVYLLAATLFMIGLNYFAPIKTILHAPVTYVGAVLIALGLFIMIWPAVAFGKVGTAIKPFDDSTHLLTDGMYRITRNPMYLGMTTILLGIATLFGTASPFVLVPVFVWIIQTKFIRHEEAALEKTFGDPYIEYKRSVRRWL